MQTLLIVPPEKVGKRLLTFIREMAPEYSQEDIRFAIEHYRCFVNGRMERFESKKVKLKERVEVVLEKKPKFLFDKKRLVYDDPHFCIYNKPAGIPSTGENGIEGLIKLPAVHRLDRDTSGALMFAKDEESQKRLENLFRERKIYKRYYAAVWGMPLEKQGTIENFLGKIKKREGEAFYGSVAPSKGQHAITEWRFDRVEGPITFLQVIPRTGRTHQIRVHLSSIGHPIVGDYRYGSKIPHADYPVHRPLLHAQKIAFDHPLIEKKRVDVIIPLPDDITQLMRGTYEKN